jgi:hypothetical protein
MASPHRSERGSGYGAWRRALSGAKQGSGRGDSFPGRKRFEKAPSRVRDADLLPYSVVFNEDNTPVILQPKGGVGQHQTTPVVLLIQAAELGR